MASFKELGFTNYTAIAQVMSDKTGTPFYRNYRALLHMADSAKYIQLLEITIEELKKS